MNVEGVGFGWRPLRFITPSATPMVYLRGTGMALIRIVATSRKPVMRLLVTKSKKVLSVERAF